MCNDSINNVIALCKEFISCMENWDSGPYGGDRDAKLDKKYNIEDIKNIPNVVLCNLRGLGMSKKTNIF